MSELDTIIHQPVRLKVVAALASLDAKGKAEFTYMRDLLSLTDGNLGAHLAKLEEAKYVTMKKTFVGKKPRTYLSLTAKGRAAFEAHIAALREIIDGDSAQSV